MEYNVLKHIVIGNATFGVDKLSDYNSSEPLVYSKSPQRTLDAKIPDIGDIVRYNVPNIKVSFEYLDIAAWRQLKTICSQAQFLVRWYDIDYDTYREGLFYCTTPLSFSNVFNVKNNEAVITGKSKVVLDLVATNNDVTSHTAYFKCVYNGKAYSVKNDESKIEVKYGTYLQMPSDKDILTTDNLPAISYWKYGDTQYLPYVNYVVPIDMTFEAVFGGNE